MSNETTILLENISAEAVNSDLIYSDKQKGSGYHKLGNGLHTYLYTVDSFVGSIKLQGTLELYPGDSDWVDIENTVFDGDSTSSSTVTGNFTGNFIWIRAAYNLEDGTIQQIRYNH